MKRVLLALTGFTLALALAAGVPGTALAGAIATSLSMSGPSTTTGAYTSGGTWTISESTSMLYIPGLGWYPLPTWTIAGSNNSGSLVTEYISGGQITISPTASTINITGTIQDGSPYGVWFTATGALTNYKNSAGYYSWDTTFMNLTGLSNAGFSVGAAPFGGGTSFTAGGGPNFYTLSSTLSAVPIPSALLFFAPALLALVGIRKRLKK